MEVTVTIRLNPEIARHSAAARNLRNLLMLLAAKLLECSVNSENGEDPEPGTPQG